MFNSILVFSSQKNDKPLWKFEIFVISLLDFHLISFLNQNIFLK